MSFQARTDYQGVFTASLPAGTYEAYWLDEHKQKQYFSGQIKVQDGMNAELGDIKLAISRFEVSRKHIQYIPQNGTVLPARMLRLINLPVTEHCISLMQPEM